MNILDENIVFSQLKLLRQWKIHVRCIGVEVGRLGMDDRQEIIPLLHSLPHPTFFTCDQDFYHGWLRHPGYCLVFIDVPPLETARYIRRFLRHSSFRTQAQRMGKIIRLHEDGITCWQVGAGEAEHLVW